MRTWRHEDLTWHFDQQHTFADKVNIRFVVFLLWNHFDTRCVFLTTTTPQINLLRRPHVQKTHPINHVTRVVPRSERLLIVNRAECWIYYAPSRMYNHLIARSGRRNDISTICEEHRNGKTRRTLSLRAIKFALFSTRICISPRNGKAWYRSVQQTRLYRNKFVCCLQFDIVLRDDTMLWQLMTASLLKTTFHISLIKQYSYQECRIKLTMQQLLGKRFIDFPSYQQFNPNSINYLDKNNILKITHLTTRYALWPAWVFFIECCRFKSKSTFEMKNK